MSMTSKRSRNAVLCNAVSGALAFALLGGCSGATYLVKAGTEASPAHAASKKQTSRAIRKAEKQVAKSPQNAAARVALADAYFQSGRFESAVATYSDAIALGESNPRVALSLALAHIGSGDNGKAVAQLDQWRDSIPAGDYGLALALAGQTNRGVSILSEELRAGNSSAKLRQNLAYAYALDGRWREARVMASQDVPADKLDDRISTWASMGKPEDYRQRVAGLLGVPVVSDAGQPAYLALADKPVDTPAVAAVGADSPDFAYSGSGELPALGEAPVAPVATPVAVAVAPEPAPARQDFDAAFAISEEPAEVGTKFVSNPVVQAAPARAVTASAQTRSTSVARAIARVSAATPVRDAEPDTGFVASPSGAATHVVQLGSFSSEANAKRAIEIFASRYPSLKERDMQITPAMVRGKKYWRVAAAGYDKSGARSMCSNVKGRGFGCIAYAEGRPLPGALPGSSGPMRARR
jgi:Flp pilus assembly protein TadD